MAIQVLLVDDHKIIRDGLSSLIEQCEEFILVGSAANGREALELLRTMQPDVVIMDISMPHLNGIDATRQILAQYPDVKVVGLSMHSNKRFIRGLLQAGAHGYLLKDCDFDELTRCLRAVTSGKRYLTQEIAGILTDDYLTLIGDDLTEDSPLSLREREVLQLLAEGKNTRQIAEILSISEKTVEVHRRNTMDKLKIHNLPDLTKYALREGLISL